MTTIEQKEIKKDINNESDSDKVNGNDNSSDNNIGLKIYLSNKKT